MTDGISDLLAKYAGSADRLRVRSAVNPFLWLAGVVTAPALAVAALTDGLVQYSAIAISAAPVLLCIFAGIWFTIKDPDKLRSEEHERFKEAMGLIERKGGALSVSSPSVTATANVYRGNPRLKPGSGDTQNG